LLAYFRNRALTPAQRVRLGELIPRLGHDSFHVRQQASLDLMALGPGALPHLRARLGEPDEEIRERLRAIIGGLQTNASPAVSGAAARLLRARAAEDTPEVLLAYLPDAEEEAVAEEVLCTLAVRGVRDGKVVPILIEALKDPEAVRRGAAALVLGRSGTREQRAAVRSLLTDSSPLVRFRAAQGLLAGRDRAAIPSLIALLTEAPEPWAVRAEDLLGCLAGSRAPRAVRGESLTSRRRCRAAWENWWQANRRMDLSRADVDLPSFNATLRSRLMARQFIAAFLRGDRETIERITEVPFLLGPEQVFNQVVDLENQMGGPLSAMLGQPNAEAISSLPTLRNLDHVVRTVSATERTFLGRFRNGEIRVIEVLMPSSNLGTAEGAIVLVRHSGRQMRIVGFNASRWLPAVSR
jgi:HEAT repeat protein